MIGVAFDLRDFRLYSGGWITRPNSEPRSLTARGFCHARRLSVNLDAHLPAYLAARQAGVSPQLLHWWRRSGLLEPIAQDKQGRPLYRVGDVLAVELRTRRSPKSHRASVA